MSKGPRTRIPGATPWCGYGVPSPTDGSPTYWWTDDELRMRPWPAGVRYAPLPPRYDATGKQERREDLGDFYSDVYFPWLAQAAASIAADFAGAAARFTAEFGAVTFPGARVAAASRLTAEFDRWRKKYEAITAASRVRHGRSIADVARHLGMSWETARKRVLTGEQILAADPAGARQFIVDYLHRALEDDPAQRLAAALLDGAQFEASQVAARLFEAEAKREDR